MKNEFHYSSILMTLFTIFDSPCRCWAVNSRGHWRTCLMMKFPPCALTWGHIKGSEALWFLMQYNYYFCKTTFIVHNPRRFGFEMSGYCHKWNKRWCTCRVVLQILDA